MRRLLTIIAILFAISFQNVAFAQQDCQEIDCTGQCGRFVDDDGDGFCDHGFLSEPEVHEEQSGSGKRAAVVAVAILAVAVAAGVTVVALRKNKRKE